MFSSLLYRRYVIDITLETARASGSAPYSETEGNVDLARTREGLVVAEGKGELPTESRRFSVEVVGSVG
jgi:hypothetical protein